MKKSLKKMTLLPLLAISAMASLSGCGGSQTQDGMLTIRYYNGGYGNEWLYSSMKSFLAEKKGTTPDKIKENVDFSLIADSQVTENTNAYLKSKVPDILMTLGGMKSYITQGLIEPLDDVFEMEVSRLDGSKVKVKDMIDQNVRNKFTQQRIYGQGQAFTWAMPWGNAVQSIAYNEDLLLDTLHTDSTGLVVGEDAISSTTNKWLRAPQTVDEMLAYFNDINARNDGTIPFGWAGEAQNWFDFIVNSLWAQYQGITTSNYFGEGTFYDFFNVGSPEVFKQTGIVKALETLQKMIVSNGSYINSPKNVINLSLQDMSINAAKGKYAMWLAGDFFENELKNYFDQNGDGKNDFKFKMTYIPSATSENLKYTFVNSEEVMFIPSRATNKDLAKEYLAYLCSEKELLNFTKSCGTMRPFKYDPRVLDPTYNWTDWQQSTFSMYLDCDARLLKYPVGVENVSPIYLYNDVGIYMLESNFTTFYDKLLSQNPADMMNTEYNLVKQKYSQWKRDYNL